MVVPAEFVMTTGFSCKAEQSGGVVDQYWAPVVGWPCSAAPARASNPKKLIDLIGFLIFVMARGLPAFTHSTTLERMRRGTTLVSPNYDTPCP